MCISCADTYSTEASSLRSAFKRDSSTANSKTILIFPGSQTCSWTFTCSCTCTYTFTCTYTKIKIILSTLQCPTNKQTMGFHNTSSIHAAFEICEFLLFIISPIICSPCQSNFSTHDAVQTFSGLSPKEIAGIFCTMSCMCSSFGSGTATT